MESPRMGAFLFSERLALELLSVHGTSHGPRRDFQRSAQKLLIPPKPTQMDVTKVVASTPTRSGP